MDLAEALIATLLDGGISPREAAWTGWGMIYFILWPTQEEQALPDRSGTDDLAVGERLR
ncbi:hypothetical protein [Amycolatopsis sp. NPDC057786]|uniref:hypothetical protein n=1 Tax=Amycolatopsis sp. NPDC057786 TaxID=3346250 RepID=UPI00366FDDEC